MRIREKRRREREQRSQAQAHAQPSKRDDKKDKVIDVDAVVRPRGPIIVPRSFTPTPTLSAAEKVAFDNRIKRKNVLALNEKVAALREYDRVPVYKHVGRLFNCSPDQIKRIVQQRQEIMSAWEQRTRRTQDAGTMETKTMRVSMLGKAVYDWIRRMMYYKDFIISDGLIQKMALQFKSSMGLANFFPHQEWCDKFRSTYGIESSDTKLLKIGYTQSYSVQIKDIVKDVTSECKPNESSNQQNEGEDEQDDGNASLPSSFSSHAGEEDDEVDVDGGDISEREEEEEDVKPSLSELNLARAAHPLPQLVRLPMPLPLNTPPGTSQKVLLATPILPPGAKPPAGGAQPMTMTIIPLATLAQSITKRPSSQPQLPEKGPVVPAPMVEIKQEKDIKAEPIDPEEETETDKEVAEAMAPSKAQPDPEPEAEAAPVVRIKEEPLEEDELEDDANGGRSSVTSLAEVLAANKENEMEYIEQMRQRRQSTAAEGMPTLPPMPALTMAPAAARQGIKRRQPMDHDDNNNGGQSASGTNVISCADARKYLKLLEQFALHKGNIRLIGLITRADEVMREVDDASS